MISRITEYLYLGDAADAKRLPEAYDIICIAPEIEDEPARAQVFKPFAEYGADGTKLDEDELERTLDAMDRAEAEQRPTLLHCRAGIERSPYVMIRYLMRKKLTYDEAYHLVKRKHPRTIEMLFWNRKY